MIRTRFAAVAACVVMVVGVGASAAFAGEVKGPQPGGPTTDYTGARSNSNSVCSYSGQNDNPTSTNPRNPGGQVQSYGWNIARNGLKDVAPSPGDECQGGSNPNRDK